MTDIYDISHGVGGLWHVHKWNNDLEINTELEDGANRYVLASIDGLHSLPPRDLQTTPKVGRIGDNYFRLDLGGKPVTYTGQIEADTEPDLKQLGAAMRAAFAPTAYGTMDVIPQVPGGDTSPTARYYAVTSALDIREEITGERPIAQFTLGLYLIDPRAFFLGLAVDEGPAASVTVTNPGSAPADPIVSVAGASGSVSISDGTHTLAFKNCPSGTLVIDFAGRTAKVGSDQVELDAGNSDWWDSHIEGIAGGATVTITKTGGTSVEVEFVPSSW